LSDLEALFVHGMGRTPVSGWPMLWKLRRAGLRTSTFSYLTSVERFARISDRLSSRLMALAARGDYVLIGHSLGGVLIRAAVSALPAGARKPRHVFLLGSPVHPSRLARRLQANPVYRVLTRDCGHLLASAGRMATVGRITVPTTSIVGVRGLALTRTPFGGELNDGVVSVGEASADWLAEQIRIPCVHTLLPASPRVAEAILERLSR